MSAAAAERDLEAAIERHKRGGAQAAIAAYERILAGDPENMTALRHLGLAHFQVGLREQGVECLRRVTARSPDAAAWSDLGRMHAILGRLQEAIACFRRAVAADPGHADGWHNLGTARRQAGDSAGALAAYQRALALDPKRGDTYLNLGNLLVDDNQPERAIESFRRAALLDPRLAQARARLAGELSGRGDVSDAELVYRQAVALDPRHVQAWFGLGRTLEDLGRADEAAACYRRALELRPLHPWALGQLLSLAGARADDALLAQARDALAEAAVSDAAKALIGYGLGKALDRRGEYDAAFAVLRRANQARRREAGPFDPAAFGRRVERLIETFTPAFFQSRAGFGSESELPVFIVGMPRSGTTLAEQVLDRHPQLHGAGELPDLAELAADLPARFGLRAAWPLCAPELGRADVEACARDYLERLQARAPAGVVRVTDKSPLNFFHLGLVGLLFPKARVVHCRRDPIDTCLSIYFENFRLNQTHATDLRDIAAYYRGYQRLMAHWRGVLPLPMMELQYEQVVEGLEGRARALLELLGLPWDARCLAFHESDRAVQTPSRWQVRRPLYGASVGRWRNYARHLGALTQAFPEAAGEATRAPGSPRSSD